MFNRFALGAAFLVSAFFAAGNPAQAETADWSGFYLGAHAGGIAAKEHWKWNQAGLYAASAGETHDPSVNGLIAGGQAGYLHQWGPWVAGVELSATTGHLKDKSNSTSTPGVVHKTTIDWFATAAAKFGYAREDYLFYGLAGYAGTDIHTSTGQPGVSEFFEEVWQSGFLLGAGVDYKLSKHIVLGAQYNYMHIPERDRTGTGQFETGGSTGVAESISTGADYHIATLRMSWQF